MFEKMKQAEKEKRAKRDEEIAKFKAEWYARPYLDRLKKPAITFIVLLLLGFILTPFFEFIGGIIFLGAFLAGFMTFGIAIGGCPHSSSGDYHSSWNSHHSSSSDYHTSPTYSHLPGNIHHSSSSDYYTSPTYSHLPGNIHHSSSTDHHSSWNSHHSSSSDYHTSPSYSHLPGNIYHNSWND